MRKNDGISLDKKREKIRQNKYKKIKISAYKGAWSWKASQYSVRLSVSVDERKQRTRSERNAEKKRAFVWPSFHFHNFTQSFHLSTNEKWWSDVDINVYKGFLRSRFFFFQLVIIKHLCTKASFLSFGYGRLTGAVQMIRISYIFDSELCPSRFNFMRQVLDCFTDVLKYHWGYVLETILVGEN